MLALRGSLWGPPPLPEFLTSQLEDRGLTSTDAPECVHRIRQASPSEKPASFVDLGACKMIEGDVDGAIASWRQAISSADLDASARALLNLGLLYEHLHLHRRALGILESVADRDIEPHTSHAAMAMARCHCALDQPEAAMETMARLAESTMVHRPDSDSLGKALLGLGEVAEAAGRPDRAERAWRAASVGAETPARRAAVERLAALLLRIGRDDELAVLLATENEVGSGAVADQILARAETLLRLGHSEQAEVLTASIQADGLATDERFRLAEVRLQLGLVNEAIDELEVLLGDPLPAVQQRAAFSLGEVYRTYEMDEAAGSMYERVVEASDDYWSPKAALVLGDLMATSGRDVLAESFWKQAADCTIGPIQAAAKDRLLNGLIIGTVPDADESETLALSLSAAEPAESESTPPASNAPVAPDELAEPIVVDLRTSGEAEVLEGASADAVQIPVNASKPRTSSEPPEQPLVVLLSSVEDQPTTDSLIDSAVASTRSNGNEQAQPADNQPTRPAATSAESVTPPRDRLESSSAERRVIKPPASAPRAQELPNPYAALAPRDSHETDAIPSSRNPYAELAPNYDDSAEPASDVEAGDWESILDDWPRPPEDERPPKKRPSAFSRYT